MIEPLKAGTKLLVLKDRHHDSFFMEGDLIEITSVHNNHYEKHSPTQRDLHAYLCTIVLPLNRRKRLGMRSNWVRPGEECVVIDTENDPTKKHNLAVTIRDGEKYVENK